MTLRLVVFFVFILNLSFANKEADSVSNSVESTKTLKKDGKYFRDKTVIPLPIVFRFPETGFGGGALASATFRFTRDKADSKPSQVSIAGAYTQNKQILLYMPFSIFADNNKYYVNGEIGWFRYNYKFFGIGENQTPEESYEVDYPRVRLLATKLIGKNIYAGFRYLLEDYNITETKEGGELASNRVAGGGGSMTSSLGIAFLKDSRDKVFYPRKGVFGEFSVLPTLKVFGADRNFNRITLDVAKYHSLNQKTVLAGHFFGSFMQGDNIPFNQLSLLGGQRKMRGSVDGRYRDENFLLLQAESRFEVWKFIGFTTFASVGFLGNESAFLRFSQPKFAFGGGLRLTAIKKEHINLRIDYGIHPGEKGNFYLTVGEAF